MSFHLTAFFSSRHFLFSQTGSSDSMQIGGLLQFCARSVSRMRLASWVSFVLTSGDLWLGCFFGKNEDNFVLAFKFQNAV